MCPGKIITIGVVSSPGEENFAIIELSPHVEKEFHYRCGVSTHRKNIVFS